MATLLGYKSASLVFARFKLRLRHLPTKAPPGRSVGLAALTLPHQPFGISPAPGAPGRLLSLTHKQETADR